MKDHVSHHLSSLSEEISATQARLDRLRDRLDAQQAALDECRLRMLIAETPLADRDLHAAATDYLRVEREVRRVEQAITLLHADERGLARRVVGAGT
jgi:uncharacterized protein (DUF2267 family)